VITPPRRTLVLASRSPQRRALLAQIGVPFTVREVDVHELGSGDPTAVAHENARRKALAGAQAGAGAGAEGAGPGAAAGTEDALVLGVDTLVTLDGRIYGKPADEAAARATLQALSGRRHEVISGLATVRRQVERTLIVITGVTFRALDEPLLDWYLATGEWRERAGGYAIQGRGAALVAAIDGDYSNVVGLPLAALLDLHPELQPSNLQPF
jgi:septum formation protein